MNSEKGRDSKKKEWRIIFLWISIFLFFVLVYGCAKQRVNIEKSRPPVKTGVYHVVERHQTLFRICKTYGVDIQQVVSVNRIADPGCIQVGQRVFIPGARRVLKVDIYIDDVVSETTEKDRLAYRRLDFMWPVEGRVTQTFDETESKRHMGIDISAPAGTPFRASNPGRVIYSGDSIRGYGNLIILRHSDEYVSIYAHNQVNWVDEGEWVEKGQVIGQVGQTGSATGPHLHFEIRENNKSIDPLLFLRQNK